jgi:hypothetical protein
MTHGLLPFPECYISSRRSVDAAARDATPDSFRAGRMPTTKRVRLRQTCAQPRNTRWSPVKPSTIGLAPFRKLWLPRAPRTSLYAADTT